MKRLNDIKAYLQKEEMKLVNESISSAIKANKGYISQTELCRWLGVSICTFNRLIRDDIIVLVKTKIDGNKVYFSKKELTPEQVKRIEESLFEKKKAFNERRGYR